MLLRLSAAVVLLAFAGVTTAKADVVTFEFTGEIVDVDASLAGVQPIEIGDLYSFRYSFDADAGPIDIEGHFGISSLILTIYSDPLVMYVSSDNTRITFNYGDNSCCDFYGIDTIHSPNIVLGAELINVFQLLLKDNSGAAIDSNELPSTPPDLLSFPATLTSIDDWFGVCNSVGCTGLMLGFAPNGAHDFNFAGVVGNVQSVTARASPLPEVDLEVTISESIDPVTAGSGLGNLTYTVTITNNGPEDATGVEASRVLTLPAGVTVDSTTPSGSGTFDGTTWTIGDLADGESATLTVVLTADATTAPGADVISLTSAITALDQTDSDPDNDTATEATSVNSEGTITIVKVTSPAIAGDGTFSFSSSDDLELDTLELATVGNTATSVAFTKTAGSYTVTEDETEGWRLDDISCTGDESGGPTYDLEARSVTIDLDGSEAITCTFTNVRDEEHVTTRTQRVISNFLSRRADQITANDPELVSRLTRRGDSNGSGGALGFTATGTLSDHEVTFSTSLSRIANAHQAAGLAAGGRAGTTELSKQVMSYNPAEEDGAVGGMNLPGVPRPGLDVWIEGKFAHADDESRNSDIGLLYVGADYLINPSLLVGVLAQFDWMDEEDKTEGVSANGTGWMAGPYVVARLHQNLLFDGRLAWGQSDNHVDPLGLYTDSFDTNRWLARGQLTGDFRHGDFLFSPHARVIYFEEDQKAYTDSLGIMIPGQKISLGRVIFGPKMSYAYRGTNGLIIEPHIGIDGIWDFDKAEIVDLTTGLPVATSEDLRARVDGGLSVRFNNGWSLLGEGFYDGIGIDDLDIYGGRVRMTVPLH